MKKYKLEVLKKGIVLVGGLSVLLSSPVLANEPVSADSTVVSEVTKEEIEVTKGVNLYVDDRSFTPYDVNGNEVDPFIYNGTTYAPIRAITSLLNYEVGYNGKTKTVELKSHKGDIVNKTPFREMTDPYKDKIKVERNVKITVDGKPFIPMDVNGKEVDILLSNGTTYIPIRALANLLELPIYWDSSLNTVFLGKHMEQIDPNNYDNEVSKEAQKIFNYTELLIYQIGYHCEYAEDNFDKLLNVYSEKIRPYQLEHDASDALYQELVEATRKELDAENDLKNDYSLIYLFDYPLAQKQLEMTNVDMSNVTDLVPLKTNLSHSLYVIRRSSQLCVDGDNLLISYDKDVTDAFAKYGKTLNYTSNH